MPRRGASATGLSGIKEARATLSKILRASTAGFQEIVEDEATRLLEDAVAMTPYQEGTLESSVYVKVSKDKRRPGFLIGASALAEGNRYNYNYAAIQHEREDFEHQVKGEAHYLLIPFEDATRRIQIRLRRSLKAK